MSDDKIDDACYAKGRTAFNTGSSVREIVESIKSAADLDDPTTFSLVLGFIDAAFDRLRGIQR